MKIKKCEKTSKPLKVTLDHHDKTDIFVQIYRKTGSMGDDYDLSQRFERLKQMVLAKRPILAEILRKRGQKKLLEYANQYVDVNLGPAVPQRQTELIETVHELTDERFGTEVANSVAKQLKEFYFVSTADHLGPLTHPFFVNSNLLMASTILSHSCQELQNIVVLGCANVSHNNSSYPRGFLFNQFANGQYALRRLPLLPTRIEPHVVYSIQPFTPEHLHKTYASLRAMHVNGEVGVREYDVIQELIKEIYDRPEIFSCRDYCEQTARTNFVLWQKFFQASGMKLPNLIHLEKEWLVVKLINKYHLYQDTIINHVLFDPQYEPYINNYFEGIYGSFSRADMRGTYLFWALPKGCREYVQLWRKGNYLVSKDESYKVELNPEVLKAAMESKELIPNILLKFMVVCFYYGLKCLGGFNQVNYLTLLKNNYIKMNADLGNYRSVETCARAQTKELVDGLSIAFLGASNSPLTLATGIDLILYGRKDGWNNLMHVVKTLSFDEAFSPLLPDIYRISYDKKEWEDDLLTVTENDINKLEGIDKKVKPCAIIS
ncbi:MAG: hypothetical protein WC285_04880 [Candidatus Gracilibacteria bacterium]|jgi:hypothetical protein